MFIESQSGKLFNTEQFVSIELLDNEIYGFTAESKNVLIGRYDTRSEAEENFEHIKTMMEYYCCLISMRD